jgi:GT2 family glycosyltransferase
VAHFSESVPSPSFNETSVSVVIVSWNTRAHLHACLGSLATARRHVPGTVQTVVVDNASSDGSVEMLHEDYPWVVALANATNRGFAAATNQGIRASTGRYVLLLNPDTEVEPTSIRHLVEFLDRHEYVAAVGPRIVGPDGTLQASCFPLPTLGREIWRLFHLDALRAIASYRLEEWAGGAPRQVEALQGACVLVRRTVLDRIGLLDERFFIYTEEVDLCRRMSDSGWELFWVPQASIVHFGGQSTRQVARRMFLELYRSKVQYFRKHRGVRGALAYKLVLAAAAIPRVVTPAILIALRPRRRRELTPLIRNYSSLLMTLPTL